MKTGKALIGVAMVFAATVFASSARAQTMTRYSFTSISGAPVSGSFALTNNNNVYSLTAYNATNPGGQQFSVANTVLLNNAGSVTIGGQPLGANGLDADLGDFRFSMSPTSATQTTGYTYELQASGGRATSNITIIQQAAPEPGSWALMILGFGVVGGGLRTRRRGVVRDTSAARRNKTI